jgi:Protein kinase domain
VDQPLGSRYVLHGLLGRGAMGQVFRGSARDTGGVVAVKVLKPELVSDPEVVARFFQERSILTSIDHPNVVRVTDLVVEGETLGIVMDLVEGTDLRRFLRERGTLPPAEAVGMVCQLLDGLAAVHAAGIVHRDVKPENVLVDLPEAQPRIRLTDFGVARLSYGASLTKLSSLIGTPEYMAPEVADHDSAAPAADLYSAGIVLYELLSGRTPFAGGHPLAVLRRQVEYPPPPIPGVPGPLWVQLEALLAKDPAARPGSAAQAAGSLASLAGSLAGAPALPVMADPGPEAWMLSHAAQAGATATVPGDGAGEGTVLRHRDRGVSGGSPRAVGVGTSAGKRRRGARPVVIALSAALVVAAAAGVVVLRSQQAPPQATHQAAGASYAFAPQQYPDGLLAVRRWALGGNDGSLLTERVTVSSATGKPVRAVFEEAIPVAIAPTVQTVRFTPAPAQIVQADPVVQWDLQLPAQGSVTVGYQAHVPATGATKSRLLHWAQALTTIQARLSLGVVTVELQSLTVRPQLLHLAAAATAQLTLSGVLRNGKPAPSAIVSAAAWSSADPAVAIVDPAGKVTATGPGATYLTAQVGAAHATVTVTVPGSQPLAQGGTGPASPNPATSGSSGAQPRVTTPPATQPPTPQPSPTPPPPPPPATYSETVGGNTHTWTNYTNAGGTEGPTIASYTTVQVACKLQGFRVADGDTWWYRIASSPWSNAFYASADAFYNNGQTSGSLNGTPFVDNNVRNC